MKKTLSEVFYLLREELKFLYILLVIVVVLLLLPIFKVPFYWIRFITNILLWIGLTESLNIITGYTGRVDFGHVAFFGVGAYTVAISISYGFYWPIGLVLSGIFALLLAILIGAPTLRLHGAYFAIATWSFAEALKQLFNVLRETGASYGISVPAILSSIDAYYLILFLTVSSIITNITIEKHKLGFAFRAIRDGEIAAATLGVNISKYRLIAFMISALYAGFLGGAYALWINYVYPGDAFAGLKTDQMFVMLLLGGVGSYLGPIIGATVLLTILEVLWTYWTEIWYMVFLGTVIMFIVLLMPQGIVGLILKRREFISIRRILREALIGQS
ncbi:MAG: branched-chain amino acid ABC transporter permease [Candidatus Methanomethylicia archaeon]